MLFFRIDFAGMDFLIEKTNFFCYWQLTEMDDYLEYLESENSSEIPSVSKF